MKAWLKTQLKKGLKILSGKDRSEIIKNWSTIIAIIAAALWAIYLFEVKERPGLEIRGSVTSESLLRTTYDPDTVEIAYVVTVENKGATAFDINKIHLQAWEFDAPQLTKRFNFLDVDGAKGTTPFHDKIYDLSSPPRVFPSHYAPGQIFSSTFNFFLVKPDCAKWVLLAVEFYENGHSEPTWSSTSWRPECENVDLRRTNRPPPPAPSPLP